MIKQIIIILLGCAAFALNLIIAKDPIPKDDTHNVGHQFYDALITTPKEAVVNAAVATKDLAKTVANCDAAHDLKEAGKQLVIETPVKTGYAIKNGAHKLYDATKDGAYKAYDVIVVTPAHAISQATQKAVHSDLVQGIGHKTKAIADQIKDVGHKAYHTCIERPAHAIKEAAHTITHHHHHHHHEQEITELVKELFKAGHNTYVAVIEIQPHHKHQEDDVGTKGLIILPEEMAKNTVITVTPRPQQDQTCL